MRLEDGPGKCAGRLEIQYEGRWKQVYEQNWTDTNSNTVCKQMNCGNKHLSPHRDKFIHGSGDFLTKTVECNTEASTIHECFPNNPKGPSKSEAVGITCEGEYFLFVCPKTLAYSASVCHPPIQRVGCKHIKATLVVLHPSSLQKRV